MKNTFVLIIIVISLNSVFAQSVTISGKVTGDNRPANISLVSIVDGGTDVVSTSELSANGSFNITFIPGYEGFYTIGGKDDTDVQFPLYVKGGERFDIEINDKAIKYIGELNPESKILAEWVAMSEVVRNKSQYWLTVKNSTYKDFFPDLEALTVQIPEFVARINTGNERFNELMKDFVKYSAEYYAIYYRKVPRSEHPKPDEVIDFYKTIVTPNHFQNDNVLQIPINSKSFLSIYITLALGNSRDVNQALLYLGTDKQKGEFLSYAILPTIKKFETYQSFVSYFGKYFVTPSQKKILEETGAELNKYRVGGAAIDFTYPDLNGKMISLSDFKGKVVLVDVWATWCAPCREQIPYMKKLEEELHGMDIVFLSVSTDNERDSEKWKQMVIDQELGGVHVFAGQGSKFSEDYKITSIPHFMLFDKDGNIISIDAPRPSSPMLKDLIIKYIN